MSNVRSESNRRVHAMRHRLYGDTGIAARLSLWPVTPSERGAFGSSGIIASGCSRKAISRWEGNWFQKHREGLLGECKAVERGGGEPNGRSRSCSCALGFANGKRVGEVRTRAEPDSASVD